MRIAHLLVCHSFQPTKLFASIEAMKDSPWFVFLHSDKREIFDNVSRLLQERQGRIFDYKTNRGLARSWNEGIKLAEEDGSDAILLLNDDLFFYPGGYQTFRHCTEEILKTNENAGIITVLGQDVGHSPTAGTVVAQNFSCCVITKRAIEKIGYLDENFSPAYYEDVDYMRRNALAGLDFIIVDRVLLEHERSATKFLLSAQEIEVFTRSFTENSRYYIEKWGGDMHAETYPTPFKQNTTLHIPFEERHHPYGPGYDRDEACSSNLDNQHDVNRGKAMDLKNLHSAAPYGDVMAQLSAKRRTKTYLEIGVSTGALLQQVTTEHAICVDPAFDLSTNIARSKKRVSLYQMTSDEFFALPSAAEQDKQLDLAFLDGMHLFEYLLRDFYNTESRCHSQSLIALHDCLPMNEEMAHRSMQHSLTIGQTSDFPNYWTGDVWKIIPILQKYRPDLQLVFVNAPPTGLVFVTNLNPQSDILGDNYLDIVKEFTIIPNTIAEIKKMYLDIEITDAGRILQDMDYSLYFRQ